MAVFKDTLQLIDKVSEPLKKVATEAEKSAKAIEKAKKANERLQKTYSGLGGAMRRFNSRLSVTYTQLGRFNKRMERVKQLGNDITGVGNKMTVGLTLPIVALGGAAVKAAADLEAMKQQLSTMLQSEEKGAAMFKDITSMAAKTPFGTKDLMAATNTLVSFGIAQEKVLPIMQKLGDISGGDAQKFQSLTLAFSQATSAGKLQGQDLLQMINAGFNPLDAIAKRTGKSVGYWREKMSKGAISAQMLEQAITDATSEGGKFYQMMQKQSKTALGQWSTMQDNLNMALAEFGFQIMPYAIKALQKFSKFLEWLNSLSPATKKVIIVLAGVTAVIGPLIAIIGGLISGIASLGAALMFLSANPIILTIAAWTAGIAALIAIIVLLVKNWKSVWGAIVNFSKSVFEKISNWLSNIIEKLGFLKYLLPGVGGAFAAVDVAKWGAGKINSYRQNNISNITKTSNVFNHYYNSGNRSPFDRGVNPIYVTT